MYKYHRWGNWIETDHGFKIDHLGQRVGFRYTEGTKSYFIDSERGVGEKELITFSTDGIYPWGSEHCPDNIVNEEERRHIVDNIKRAFAAVGIIADVSEPFI